MVASLPLVDALLAVLRRLRSSESPLRGDRRHCYDLLVTRGWPSRKVAFACYAITLVFVLVGLLIVGTDSKLALWISAIAVGSLLLASLRLGSLGKNEVRSRMQRVKV